MSESVFAALEPDKARNGLDEFGDGLRELGSLMQPLNAAADRLARSQKQMAAAVKATAKSVRNQISGFDELNLVQKESERSGTGSGKGSKGSKGGSVSTKGLTEALNETSQLLRELSEGLVPGLGTALLEQLPSLFAVGESFSAIFGGLHEKFSLLGGLFQWLAGLWQSFVAVIGAGWALLGQPALDALLGRVGQLAAVFSSFYNGVLLPVFQLVGAKIMEIAAFMAPVWERLFANLGELAAYLVQCWTVHLAPLAEFLSAVFGPVITWLGQLIAAVMGDAGQAVKDVVYAVGTVLEGLCDFLKVGFSKGWKEACWNLVRISNGIGQGALSVVRNALNLVIDLLNALMRAFVGVANAITGGINKLGVTVPSWVPGIGGKRFAPSLPSLPEYQIPRLARGAVLPANRPFLAMVGDQRRGTNVEAPLDTIKQAVAEVLSEIGSRSLTAAVPVELSLDGEVLYRAVNRVQISRGAEIGGAFAEYY